MNEVKKKFKIVVLRSEEYSINYTTIDLVASCIMLIELHETIN